MSDEGKPEATGMRIAMLMMTLGLVVGGCPATTPTIKRQHDRVSADETEPAEKRGTILRVTRHWASCEPGSVMSATLAVGRADGSGEVAVSRVLAPGDVHEVALPAGSWWHRVVDADGAILEEAAVESAGGHTVIHVGVGCSPAALRADALAAVVLVPVDASGAPCDTGECRGVFRGEVRLGGVAITMASGLPQTMRLPRGTHALVTRAADATSDAARECGARDNAVVLEEAGVVAFVDRCGVVKQQRL